MSSVMAIISKKIFEQQAKQNGVLAGLGDVLPLDRYLSANKRLEPLTAGGTLFLVTVRPGEELWLVAMLEQPRFKDTCWEATANTIPMTNVSAAIGGLRFDTGKGITAKPGALGMSLQTPRVLTDEDVALLRGAPAPKPKAKTKAQTTKPTAKPKQKNARAEPSAHVPVPSTGSRFLLDALKQVQAGDTIGALQPLLEAWGEDRSSEVAELIDRASEEVTRSLPPVVGKAATQDALQIAWLDAAAAKHPEDLGRLLAALAGSVSRERQRVELLDLFPPDPRLAMAMAQMVTTCKTSTERKPMFTRIFRMLPRINDGRTLAVLKQKLAEMNCAYLRPKLEKALGQIQPIPSLRSSDAEAVSALGAALDQLAAQEAPSEAELRARVAVDASAGVEQELVDMVLADPADDAPRLIYMDWLLERGDPRGEFIQLQFKRHNSRLTAKEAKRERELLKTHLAEWTSPLDVCLKLHTVRFSRGFLSAAELEFKTDKQREDLVGHPMWATVEEL
ncbi:MAG: TIGR02996 domain-containing protein, partial [Deltaproteobacteria bacterium]|nr:TIGR02996 domain-containing protein [Deltaproteobacteria bacterium]